MNFYSNSNLIGILGLTHSDSFLLTSLLKCSIISILIETEKVNIMKELLNRADELLIKRGICGHVAAERFESDFKAYLIYFEALGYGSADTTLTLLENEENLTDTSILNTNFRCKIDDLISQSLKADKIFMELFDILLGNNGKGVGAGELALPLIFSKYRYSNSSDGEFGDDNKKVEIKKNGASLKPVKTGLTDKGLVDVLNKKYFKGTVPGKKSKKLFEQHIRSIEDPNVYTGYFKELYVGCDTTELSKEVVEGAYKDSKAFNSAVGKFALKQYKRVDNFNNIIYIDVERRKVVNIADVDNIDGLYLNFSPVMRRGKDTQAIADGYVNVVI